MTALLYQTDSYLQEFAATVVAGADGNMSKGKINKRLVIALEP